MSFLPETVGCKILFLLVVLSIAIAGFRCVQHYRANGYRRRAIKAVGKLPKHDPKKFIFGLNSLLKQAACFKYQHSKVASLSGEYWLDFLSSTSRNVDFSNELAKQWQASLYTPINQADWQDKQLEKLERMVNLWLKTHH
nr:hypothetical protein BCU66_09400 [Vibrio sp. 10N.286.49.B1]